MSSGIEQKRIVIKIGSSSLTSRHGEISQRKLEKLSDEIVSLKDAGHEVVLVSSGAVAAGYRKLGCLDRPTLLPEKQAAASIGQGLLMETYSKLFMSNGYVASQILITRSDFLDENRYKNVRNTLNVLLERGIIPIVNENDTVTVDRLKFGDNDTLSAKVASIVEADQLMILSDIDGLYDRHPGQYKDAKLIQQVNQITPEIEAVAGDSESTVGTGGMRSKIEAVKIALASGIPTFLGNASKDQIVVNALTGKAKGTYFNPEKSQTYLNQKKKWIAFHSHPEGEIVIHQKAKNRLIEENAHLTLSGVYDVKGPFKKGSVIRIRDHSGREIGCGVVNISSKELQTLTKKVTHPSFDLTIMECKDFVCNQEVLITV
ncbi:glutamate 5-kinase [Niallia sp. Krafla_26]|uniref:glutamate 5-kinase n=1 Tax=Niallia sp. Krafla_26 TaxID=3064703 RepID=UPI003D1711E5